MTSEHTQHAATGSHDHNVVVSHYGNASGTRKQFEGSDPEALTPILTKLASTRDFADSLGASLDRIEADLADAWQGARADDAAQVISTLRFDALSISNNAETVRSSLSTFQDDWRSFREQAMQLGDGDDATAHALFDGFTTAQDQAMKRIPPDLVYHTPLQSSGDISASLAGIGAVDVHGVGPVGETPPLGAPGIAPPPDGIVFGLGGVRQIGLVNAQAGAEGLAAAELAGVGEAQFSGLAGEQTGGVITAAEVPGEAVLQSTDEAALASEALMGAEARASRLGTPLIGGPGDDDEEEHERSTWLEEGRDVWDDKAGGANESYDDAANDGPSYDDAPNDGSASNSGSPETPRRAQPGRR